MSRERETVPPGKDRSNAMTPKGGKSLVRRIKDTRAALHNAICRAGDKPLSQCPEVLELSRELDGLLDEMQGKKK